MWEMFHGEGEKGAEYAFCKILKKLVGNLNTAIRVREHAVQAQDTNANMSS